MATTPHRLTNYDKLWLIELLGNRLEVLGEYFHENSEQVDVSVFDRFYFQLRDICDLLEAEIGFLT